MSIYSANRSGSMVATQEATASKNNYTHADLGRILYESQVNDMAIFEAVLATDFDEIKSLREGTLLESEIAAFSEEAKEGLGKKLLVAIDVAWKKIKELFDTAKRKIVAYILRNGKAFAENYEKFVSNEKYVGLFPSSVEGYMMDDKIDDIIKIPNVDTVKSAISNAAEENLASADIASMALARSIDSGASEGIKSAEFYNKVCEKAFRKRNIDRADAKACVEFLKNAKKSIDEIKKKEAEVDKAIKDLKQNVSVFAKKDAKESAAKTNTVVSAYQTVLSTTASASIKVINQNIKYSRLNLAAIMTGMKENLKKEKTDKAIGEAMMLEAVEEFDEIFNNAPSVDPIGNDESFNAQIDKIIADAEEE